MQLDILTCDHGGCFTGAPIKAGFLNELRKGKQLTVTFQTAQRKEITIPVTLKGLVEAWSKAKLR